MTPQESETLREIEEFKANKIACCKAIIAREFKEETNKARSAECKRQVGNALQTIEIEVQKKFSKLESGTDIFDIIPLSDFAIK